MPTDMELLRPQPKWERRLLNVLFLLAIGIVSFMLILSMGCRTELFGQGTVRIQFTQGVEISHTAAATTEDKATAELKSQPLTEWLAEEAEEEEEPDDG